MRKCILFTRKKRRRSKTGFLAQFSRNDRSITFNVSRSFPTTSRRERPHSEGEGGRGTRRAAEEQAGGNAEVGRRRGDCGGGVGEVEGGEEGEFSPLRGRRRTTRDDAGGKKRESAERVR